MFNLSALQLSSAIRAKQLGVVEVTRAYLEGLELGGNKYNAFVSHAGEKALARAEILQKQLDDGGVPSPLFGVPIAVKDNISTLGLSTNCASKMLAGYEPVYNATVVEKLERAGLIIVGKLNMDEFAMGGSSETGAYGPVLNPCDMTRVAGGSSGGSAAAVASGEVPIALGSDTGGSIRQPCAFCGVTGIKPTYGAVSRHGLIAYASSLDQIGPMGRDVDDCAALLAIISGPDARDATCSIRESFEFGGFREETRSVSRTLRNDCMGRGFRIRNLRNDGFLRIGLPTNYLADGIEPEMKAAIHAAAAEFTAAGAAVEAFEMPLMDYVVPAYYIIACAEASSNLSRYDGLKYGYQNEGARTLSELYKTSRSEGFGLEVKRRIMLGSFVLSSGYYDAYYKKALQVRGLICAAYADIFTRFDMILSPVAPTVAYKIGENLDDPVKMYMGDIYTVSVNMAGLPAVALPCGTDTSGLPIGMQLIGPAFSEAKLIDAAREYEARTERSVKR